MLRWRLLLGTLIIAALVGLCWLDAQPISILAYPSPTPGVWLLPLVAIIAILATQETLSLAAKGNIRPPAWPVYFGNLLIVTGNWLVALISDILWRPEDRHIFYPNLYWWCITRRALMCKKTPD